MDVANCSTCLGKRESFCGANYGFIFSEEQHECHEAIAAQQHGLMSDAKVRRLLRPVSYTHLTLPTNREV